MLDPAGKILFPGHSRWPEFITRLSNKVGDGCTGNLSYSVITLYAMDGLDGPRTIEHFRNNCATYCDCEVLLRDACGAVFSPPQPRPKNASGPK
jgi:hypothetical protein